MNTFKTKAVIRENLCKLKAKPEEVALYVFSMSATYDRGVQFVTSPTTLNCDNMSELQQQKNYKHISEVELFIRKINKYVKVELICFTDKSITKGCKYKYIINIYDKTIDKLLFSEIVEPYTKTGAPITSIVGYGSKPNMFYYVDHEYTGQHLFSMFKNVLNF